MRITYLLNSSIPSKNPSSIQVAKTCEALFNLSNQVNLIVPSTGLKISLKEYYGLKKNLKVIRLSFFKSFPLGLKYYLFSIVSVFYGIFLKTELFITRNLFTLFFLNLLNKKVIIEIHHDLSIESRIVRFLFHNINILNSKNIIKIVAITNAVKNYLINDLKVDSNRIHVIPSASSINLKFKKFSKNKKYNIGYFGSLEPSKGSQFISRLSKLDKSNNYFIYGGTNEQVKKLKEKNQNTNLIVSEYIPYSKIKFYLSKMDILLMPSNNKLLRSTGGVGNLAKFTSPLKLFDYMASGKLIIASNLKVFKEVIQHNENCIIINNLNIFNWKRKINKIRKNINKYNKIKKKSYFLSKQYTYLKRAKKILSDINIK